MSEQQPPRSRRRHRRSRREVDLQQIARSVRRAAATARDATGVAARAVSGAAGALGEAASTLGGAAAQAASQARADLAQRRAASARHRAPAGHHDNADLSGAPQTATSARPQDHATAGAGRRRARGGGDDTARLATPVTGTRLLAAWRDSDTGAATELAHVPTGADPQAPVRLMGTMPDYSFWVGADSDSPEVLRVQAVWERAVPTEMTSTLRRAVNDWNRDHVWPLVWTLETTSGMSVQAACHLDVHEGATDDQLIAFLDVSLSGIDTFFTALDQASGQTVDATETDDDPTL